MRNEFGNEVISINDIEFEVGPCKNCGSIATETDALREFTKWKAAAGSRFLCGACGKDVRIYTVLLMHCISLEREGWRVIGTASEPHLVSFGNGRAGITIHESCARKILPFAKWKAEGPWATERIEW